MFCRIPPCVFQCLNGSCNIEHNYLNHAVIQSDSNINNNRKSLEQSLFSNVTSRMLAYFRNVASAMPCQQCHFSNITSTMLFWSNVVSTMPCQQYVQLQQYYFNNVTSVLLLQQCHDSNTTLAISLQQCFFEVMLLQQCHVSNVTLIILFQ